MLKKCTSFKKKEILSLKPGLNRRNPWNVTGIIFSLHAHNYIFVSHIIINIWFSNFSYEYAFYCHK